jgi:signal transduction histidine kinase
MIRALGFALAWGFAAALVTLSGGLFLRHDYGTLTAQRDRTELEGAARSIESAVRAREASSGRLLSHVCTRDIQLERLTLELAAGADEIEAARVAGALAGAVDAPVVLARSKARTKPALLARSTGAPRIALQASQLEAARQRLTLVRDDAGHAQLAQACARAEGQNMLWVVSLQPAETWLLGLPPAAGAGLRLVSRDGPRPPGSLEVLALPGVTDPGLTLLVVATPSSIGQQDLALALAVLAAFLLAASLGFLVGRRDEHHEQALVTIEQAAERVAQGDLLSAIDTQLGERADRTFRTFDRMTKELRDMRERLAEAEREAAFRDVARRIAHEIKNPLSPIQISIETLRKARAKQRPDFDEIFEESTRAILEEVKRLEHIVREFGEFARLPKPTPGEIDLGKLVQDVVPMYVPEEAELTISIAPDAPRVRADREQITQVLVNLVKNALDAARGKSPVRVNIHVVPCVRGAAFVVSDNGSGIAPRERERVFEPYFTTKDEGTGLGLAIVKRIVSDHGGTIELGESELGGASVRVTLPAHDGRHSTSSP